MMKILFYISGHGFGHATRIVAIIRALLNKEPNSEIFVRTLVDKTLFNEFNQYSFHYYKRALDTGVVEKDIFSQDVYRTLHQYSKINDTKNQIVREELEFIKRKGVDIIVSDIPPIASDIAQLGKIPIIAVGNFSWDFIYESYVHSYPEFSYLIDQIKASYKKTDLLLRLPFHHDMEAFPKQTDIPLIVRKGTMTPEELKQKLGISLGEDRKLILLALRLSDSFIKKGVDGVLNADEFLLLSTEDFQHVDKNQFIVIPNSLRIKEFPNIVEISDIVISKLGYGIASECIAAKTALMYPPREDFIEHDLLQQGVKNILPNYCIPKNDFIKGEWIDHLNNFLSNTCKVNNINSDGAKDAAKIILSFVGRSKL